MYSYQIESFFSSNSSNTFSRTFIRIVEHQIGIVIDGFTCVACSSESYSSISPRVGSTTAQITTYIHPYIGTMTGGNGGDMSSVK